ncbi:hypothetical protein D3C71_1997990 [compost metagenome]
MGTDLIHTDQPFKWVALQRFHGGVQDLRMGDAGNRIGQMSGIENVGLDLKGSP